MNPPSGCDQGDPREYEWLPSIGSDRLQQLQKLAHALGLFDSPELHNKAVPKADAHTHHIDHTGIDPTAHCASHDTSASPSTVHSGTARLFLHPLASPNLSAQAALSPALNPFSEAESDESPNTFALSGDSCTGNQSHLLSQPAAKEGTVSDASYESVDRFFSWSNGTDSPDFDPWSHTQQMDGGHLQDSLDTVNPQGALKAYDSSLVVSPVEAEQPKFAYIAHPGECDSSFAPPHQQVASSLASQSYGPVGETASRQATSSIQSQFVHPASYQAYQQSQGNTDGRSFTPSNVDVVYTPGTMSGMDGSFMSNGGVGFHPKPGEEPSFKDIHFNQLQNIEFKHHRARRTFKNLPPDAAQNACYFTVAARQPDERQSQQAVYEDDIKKRRNREAAQTFRQKKKEQIIDMEVKLSSYEKQIYDYERRIKQLEDENRQLIQRLTFYESMGEGSGNTPGNKRKVGALLMVMFAVSFLFAPTFFLGPAVIPENEGPRYIGRALMGYDGGIVSYTRPLPAKANKMVYYMSSPHSIPPQKSLPDGREAARVLPHRGATVEETTLSQNIIAAHYEQDSTHQTIDSSNNQTSLIKSIRTASVSERELFQIKDTESSSYIFCNDAYQISTQSESNKNSVLSLLLPTSVLSANEIVAGQPWAEDALVQVTCKVLDIRVINPTSTPIVSDGKE